MKISLFTGSFVVGSYAKQPIGLMPVLERLARAGYDGVELSGRWPHASVDEHVDAKSRRRLDRSIRDLGLAVTCYLADFDGVSPASDRARYLDSFQKRLEMCVDLNAPAIRVDTVSTPESIPDEDYEATLSRVAETWTEAAELAARSRVHMFWEFEPGCVFNKPADIVRLKRGVAHPNFRVMFDTANAYLCAGSLMGGVPELLKKFSARIGAVHLGDSDGSLCEGHGVHCPLDDGHIDFRTLAPQLLDLPEIHSWCVDLSYAPDAWDLVESSLEFVEGLLSTKSAA